MLELMSKKSPKRGRPKVPASKAFNRRHVLNMSQEMEDAAQRFADANGIAKLTDALRQLVNKALRAEDLL